jgi:hypothetical protein
MTVVAVASHRFDYSDGPIVVFQPLPPLSDPTLSFAAGSVDYFDQQNDHPLRAPLLDSRVC